MSFVSRAIGSITGASDQAKAASRAAETQAGMSQAGIDEQRRQFDAIVELMKPYVSAGVPALQEQKNLLGLGGGWGYQEALNKFQNSDMFQGIARQGENAILQNASATGGLRSGNVQGALGQFRPTLLNQLIQQQYQNLGGLSSLGQNAAAMQGNAGQQSSANIANLLGQQGSALAGGQIARGSVGRQGFGDLMSIGGVLGGLGVGF
jgi:hypothetical protein